MTGARTIRALYCNELEMSAGQNKEAAMHRPHNRQMRQGETGTRAQRGHSGAWRRTWVRPLRFELRGHPCAQRVQAT